MEDEKDQLHGGVVREREQRAAAPHRAQADSPPKWLRVLALTVALVAPVAAEGFFLYELVHSSGSSVALPITLVIAIVVIAVAVPVVACAFYVVHVQDATQSLAETLDGIKTSVDEIQARVKVQHC